MLTIELAVSFHVSAGTHVVVESSEAVRERFGPMVLQKCKEWQLRWARSRLRWESSNNRFERSRGQVFVEPRRESMVEIKCLRSTLTKPRVAQPHR
jgi:hypothetical protein